MGWTKASHTRTVTDAAGIAAFGLSSPAQAGPSLEPVFSSTPSPGGTAIDAASTIYFSDTDQSRIRTISPEERIATRVAVPHLAWVDAMGIDDRGNLLMSASPFNRTAGLDAGVDAVNPAIVLHSLAIAATGARR